VCGSEGVTHYSISPCERSTLLDLFCFMFNSVSQLILILRFHYFVFMR